MRLNNNSLQLMLVVALAYSQSIQSFQLFEEPLMMLYTQSKYKHHLFKFIIFIVFLFGSISVSFDGFRWDYLKRFDLPNFNYLKLHGSHAEHIKNSFATVTFPSKYNNKNPGLVEL